MHQHTKEIRTHQEWAPLVQDEHRLSLLKPVGVCLQGWDVDVDGVLAAGGRFQELNDGVAGGLHLA